MATHKGVISRSISIIGGITVCLTLLLSVLFSSCVRDEVTANDGVKTGDRLPLFSITLDNGREISTESLHGKRVLIELFNTGCPDCRESLPVINRLYEAMKGNDEVEIFAIARAEDASQLAQYWEENGFSLPYSPQPDRKVYNLFASVGIPRIYIADAEGIITAAFGPEERPTLDQLINLLTP